MRLTSMPRPKTASYIFWGVAELEEEVAAVRVAAEQIAGPDKGELHLNILPKYLYDES